MQKFWIDALFLNQQDILEKDQQVLLMADIYRNAPRTCIWLGSASEDNDIRAERCQGESCCLDSCNASTYLRGAILHETTRGKGRIIPKQENPKDTPQCPSRLSILSNLSRGGCILTLSFSCTDEAAPQASSLLTSCL